MKHIGLRVLAAVLWAASLTCMFMGHAAGQHDHLAHGHLGLWFAIGAATLTIWLAIERLLWEVSNRNARSTARAVGEVVGQVMASPPDQPPTPRRGT